MSTQINLFTNMHGGGYNEFLEADKPSSSLAVMARPEPMRKLVKTHETLYKSLT